MAERGAFDGRVGPWPIESTGHTAKMTRQRLQDFNAAQHISALPASEGAERPVSWDRRVQVVSPG